MATIRMKVKRLQWGRASQTLATFVLILGLVLAAGPTALVKAGEPTEHPTPVSPAFPDNAGTSRTIDSSNLPQQRATARLAAASPIDALQNGADRLVGLQNTDGGWDWPLDDGNPGNVSPRNTIGPIAMGLAQAYYQTGDPDHLAALGDAGALLLSKTNNFSPSDGYLAVQLDQVFGGTAYRDHVTTNFYGPLAAGTYNRNGAGTLYDTAGYVNLIRTNRSGNYANLAAWDLGMGLVGAASAGASTTEWIDGVRAEIDELDSVSPSGWFDVIGLAGAVYGLAFVNEDHDPQAGEHAAASSLADLAAVLASYQISNGGFAWNANYVIPNDDNEAVQETAYAMLALNEVDRAGYLTKIQGAADYLLSVQLTTNGWEGSARSGENNEVTGEALWGIAVAYPQNWVATTGSDSNDGSNASPFATIGKGVDAIESSGIVNIAAGAYTENVNVNKSVTLNGAQAGISVGVRTAGGGSESNVAGLLTVAAADVTVDGFTLTNPDTTSSSIAALLVNSTGSNAHILNNFVQNVGNTGLVNKNVQGIYLTNGPDGITIEKNQIQHILNGNKSVKGIYLGHTGSSGDSSTNVVIQENSISDVKTNGSGGGAYGILVNMAPSVNNLRVIDNTITDVYGKWTHAIGLEGPTPNAVVLNNQFSGIAAVGTDKSAVFFEDNPDGGSVSVAFNQFNGTDFFGVAIHPKHWDPTWPDNVGTPGAGYVPINYVVSAMNNWWGHASGPNNAGLTTTTDPSTGSPATGSGAYVGPEVRFDPWLGADVEDVASQTVSNNGNVSTSDGSVSATYTGGGSPTVTVAKYTGNPGSTSTAIGAGGGYVDVNLSGNFDPNSDTLTVVFTFNAPSIVGAPLYWFDGTNWRDVSDNNGNVQLADSNGNYSVVFGPSSSPTLAQLNGTAFTPGVDTEIRLVPSVTTLAAGETLAVEVQATSLGLYGVDVSLAFNATNLEVTNVVLGDGLAADVVAVNTNGAGTLRFAFSQKADVHSNEVTGNGAAPILLATITFGAKAPGASPSYLVGNALSISSALFSDKDGNDTTPGILHGSGSPVALTINPSPSVYVDIALQGRTSVAATSGASLEMKPTGVGSVLYSTVVASRLDIDPAPAKEYDVRVDAPKYLAVIQTVTIPANAATWDLNGSVIAPPSGLILTLRGGDINGDDKINIQDLVMIGVRFGETDGAVNWASYGDLANINADGSVNIQDLSIAAGNFGLETTVAAAAKGYPAPWK